MLQRSNQAEPQYALSNSSVRRRLLPARSRKEDAVPGTNAIRPQSGSWRMYERSGAWGRIRTTDTRIFNPLLYQLSYLGAGPACGLTGT